MKKILNLLRQAWRKFADDYEKNPDSHRGEEPLIVKVSKDLNEATVCERDLICFIDRNRYHVFSLEFAFGEPANLSDIATQISQILKQPYSRNIRSSSLSAPR